MRRFPFVALLMLLAACRPTTPASNDSVLANTAQPEALSPGTQPVRIGDGGNLAACDSRGIVTPADPAALPVRAAPFDEARQIATVATGAHLFVCTRSIDQQWLGVVAPPVSAPGQDCGVAAPVDSPRAYAGPCLAGWVPSARIQLTAE